MIKTIYNLELHETLWVDEIEANVIRVASGWIYKYEKEIYIESGGYYKQEVVQIVFVPYDNNFQKVPKSSIF
jgi:hypothetical protein